MTTSPRLAGDRWRRRAALLAIAGIGVLGLGAMVLSVAGGLRSSGNNGQVAVGEPSNEDATGGNAASGVEIVPAAERPSDSAIAEAPSPGPDQAGSSGPAASPRTGPGPGPAASEGLAAPVSALSTTSGSAAFPSGKASVAGPSADAVTTAGLAVRAADTAAGDPGFDSLPGVGPRARSLAATSGERLSAAAELETMGFRAAAKRAYATLAFATVGSSQLTSGVTESGSAALTTNDAVDPSTRSAAAIGLARLALADGDAQAAAAALEALGAAADLGALPPEGAYLYGLALEKRGDRRGALKAFQHFAATSPAMAGAAQMAVGQAAFALDDYRQAAEAFTKARDASVTPMGSFLASLRRGNALLRTDVGAARAAYEDAYRRATGDVDRAQALAGRIAAAANDAEADDLRRRLVAELPATQLAAQALDKLDAAGATIPADQRAKVKAGHGDVWGALTLLDAAVKSDPKAPSSWRLQIIQWYASVGQRDQLVAEADRFLAERADDPLAASVAWERARALQALGKTADAVSAYGHFAETWPGDERVSGALWRRAWLVEQVDGVLASADAFDALARQHPGAREAADSRFRAALNYWRAGRLPKAAELWSASLDRPADAADKARAAYWLGRAAVDGVDQGPSPLAEQFFRTALEAGPADFYGARAESRLGEASAAGALAGVRRVRPNTWDAEINDPATWPGIADWLATWSGQDRAALGDSFSAVERGEGVDRARTWLAIGEADAARQALATERSRLANAPASLAALALVSMRLGLIDAGTSAADGLWLRTPASARATAPAAVRRLAYPTPWSAWVLPVAEAHGLSPALFYALIRQESRFSPTALSSAGARGLTQVMPATGAQIAGQLGLPFGSESLGRAYYALELGAWYLASQEARFVAPQPWPALSAYNGGPGNAKRWQKTAGDDLDLFVEIIDIAETRTYVKRIAENEAMYARLYDWR